MLGEGPGGRQTATRCTLWPGKFEWRCDTPPAMMSSKRTHSWSQSSHSTASPAAGSGLSDAVLLCITG